MSWSAWQHRQRKVATVACTHMVQPRIHASVSCLCCFVVVMLFGKAYLIDCKLPALQQEHLNVSLQLFAGIQTGAVAVEGADWPQLPSA